MKGLYKLCDYQFRNLFVKVLSVCIGLFVVQVAAFSSQLFGSGIRFEQFMQHAGFSTMFLAAYLLILISIALSVYQRYFGSKSMYTLMALPVSPKVLYLSFLLPAVVSVLMLCFTQIASVYICYFILIKIKMTQTVFMNNALFLSFIRYDYLRLFLPLNLLDWVRSLTLIVVPEITVIFMAFSERSRQYIGALPILFQIIWLWEIANSVSEVSPAKFFGSILICLALAVFQVFLSVRMLKKKSIL